MKNLPSINKYTKNKEITPDQCIMIVDDDLAVSEVMKEILQGENYQVITVHSAGHAYDLLHTFIPHLFIVDYWLSGGENGLSFSTWIRSQKDFDSIPIVFATANDEIPSEMKEIKNTHIIKKPFDIATLLEVVAKAIA